MTAVINYPARFIIDEHFIKDILREKEKAAKILLKLNNIHKSSKHYPMTHNRTFDECFKNAIADKQIRGPALLGAFSPEQSPIFLQNERDFETRMIKYAINLATRRPYTIIILTDEEQAKKYLINTHYSTNPSVKASVIITYGNYALKYIDVINSYKD